MLASCFASLLATLYAVCLSALRGVITLSIFVLNATIKLESLVFESDLKR